MTRTLYRIYDRTDDCIRACAIPSLLAATTLLRLIELDYPVNQLEIESYASDS